MLAWLDRFLLSLSRASVDYLAMVLTAATVAFVVVLVGRVALALGRRAGEEGEEGARR